MLHLPKSLSDETLYSLLARIAAVNGVADHLQFFRELLGQHQQTSIIGFSNGLSELSERTCGIYGSFEMIRSELTIFPVLQHLNVFTYPLFRGRSSKMIWLDGRKFDYSGNTRYEWRECPECRNKDELDLGFSYWRRSHQLPTTYCCATHGAPLRRLVILGRRLHDRFWLPHELDAQSDSAGSDSIDPEVAMALAIIGRDALNDQDQPFHPKVIRDTFYEAIKDRNLLTRVGKIRLKESLSDFNCSMRLEGSGATIPEAMIRQLLFELNISKGTVAIQHYVLFVYWLFGTWKYFKECCKWVASMSYPDNWFDCGNEDPLSTGNMQNLQENNRKICINFILTNPAATRADFLNLEYKCFRWLLRNDPLWLDAILPIPSSANAQINLFS